MFAEFGDPEYPWRTLQNVDFNLAWIAQGYIPDLAVMSVGDYELVRRAHARFLTTEQVMMAVEVTSFWNVADAGRYPRRPTKRSGYALVKVPYYLLVDRDPRHTDVTLYSDPDSDEALYRSSRSWRFGETIELPDPINVSIPTTDWDTWEE
jgi:hypothetical protein